MLFVGSKEGNFCAKTINQPNAIRTIFLQFGFKGVNIANKVVAAHKRRTLRARFRLKTCISAVAKVVKHEKLLIPWFFGVMVCMKE